MYYTTHGQNHRPFFFFLKKWLLQYRRFNIVTPPRNRRGVIFSLQFVYVCVSVCLCVCVSCSACEQNSNRTDAPIWIWFSPNGCLLHWLKAIEIGDLGSKVKITLTQYPFFLYNSLLTSILYISALLCLIKMKVDIPLRYALWGFVFEFPKNQMCDDVMVTSFKFSTYECPYFKFYWFYKLLVQTFI